MFAYMLVKSSKYLPAMLPCVLWRYSILIFIYHIVYIRFERILCFIPCPGRLLNIRPGTKAQYVAIHLNLGHLQFFPC